jgi:UDP-N-acetylmuramate dehydrogenase
MPVKYNINLAKYTSYKVGGNAKIYCKPKDLTELSEFVEQLPDNEQIFWLGLGSNVLIRDQGFNGAVIHTHNVLNNIEIIKQTHEGVLVTVGAGVNCAKLAKFCVQHNLEEGIWFAGIPGTMGGALCMNAGAFGSDTWGHVVSVNVINRAGKIIRRTPDNYQVGYRTVINLNSGNCASEQSNNSNCSSEWFVSGELFFHTPTDKRKLVNLQEKIQLLLQKRKATQPIGTLNCGSVFKNPSNNWAGKLIESANLKNKKIGGAAVSAKHANFIINEGNATARDIEQLIHFIQDRVLQVHNILLEPEVRIIGS